VTAVKLLSIILEETKRLKIAILAYSPCSWENTHKLIKRFERRPKFKCNIKMTQILQIRSERSIVIRIEPTYKKDILQNEILDAQAKRVIKPANILQMDLSII
jgi:hypothetical protein